MKGYNFTERVRKVLAMARDEAMRRRHEYVGTEHILLGLLLENEGVAAAVLQSFRVNAGEMRRQIDAVIKQGTARSGVGELPYTSRAKKVLELAMAEAVDLKHSYVGTEHLFLGLLKEEKGIAAQVLGDAGVTVEAARAETLRILGTEPAANRWAETGESETDEVAVAGGGRIRRMRRQRMHGPPFSERVAAVLDRANIEALRRQHDHVRTEHVLFALLQEADGMASALLDRLSVDRAALAAAAAAALGAAGEIPDVVNELPPSLLAAATVRIAVEEARATGGVVTTDHLLTGLLQADEGVARQLLTAAGLTADVVRQARKRFSG